MSATQASSPALSEFDSFVRARTAPLLRAAYVLTGDQHLAEDLVQAALARTYRAWPKLHATGAADSYTRKTMYHLQVSWWRRRRVAEALTGDVPAHAPKAGDDEADSTALRITLRSMLLRLTARQRAVLVLRFFDDLTEAQAAAMLGVTVGTVKSQTAKALAKLRVVAPELQEYCSSTADEVKPVDLRDRAVATSRQISVRRTATSVAVVLILAVGTVVALGARGRPNPATTPTPRPVPSVTLLPTPPPEITPGVGLFRNAFITVPSWGGGQAATTCPSGRINLGENGQYLSGQGARPINLMGYVESDVDADGTNEIVAILMCSEGPESPGTQVVAFRRGASGQLATLGRVIGTRDGFARIYALEAVAGGVTVELAKDYSDGGQWSVPFQRRTYRLVNGTFRQVAGPTTFPADPPHADVDLGYTPLRLRPAAAGTHAGRMTVTVHNSGSVGPERSELLFHLPGYFHPAGGGWSGCTAQRFPGAGVQVVCPISGPPAYGSVTLDLEIVADSIPSSSDDFSVVFSPLAPYAYMPSGGSGFGEPITIIIEATNGS